MPASNGLKNRRAARSPNSLVISQSIPISGVAEQWFRCYMVSSAAGGPAPGSKRSGCAHLTGGIGTGLARQQLFRRPLLRQRLPLPDITARDLRLNARVV